MHGRIPMLRKTALACAVLVFAITTLSAFIRLARDAAGCVPWPQCVQAGPAASASAPPGDAVVAARIAHRVLAGATLLLIVLMLVRAWAPPALPEAGRLTLALLGLALFLAVLGRSAGNSRAPPVVLGNVLAGFAMVAVSGWLAAALRRPAEPARPGLWWWGGLCVLAAQIADGALVSASGGAGGLAVHVAGGAVAVAILLALGLRGWRAGRPALAVPGVLLAAQAALGWAILGAPGPPWALALAHNALGALALGSFAWVGRARRPS